MKASDVLDRWTILRMKARVDEDADKELIEYNRAVEFILGKCSSPLILMSLVSMIACLAEANGKIWLLESAIRSGDKMDLAEVGRRALLIREHNKLRVDARKVVDEMFVEIPDNKVDHASE